MTRLLSALRLGLLLAALAAGAGLAPAAAQAPANDAALLQVLQGGQQPGVLQGRVSIPDGKAALLQQPQGREWREMRQGPVKAVGSWAILGMVAALAAFMAFRGRIKIDAGPARRTIERFSGFERFTHWITASSFILLALTGLNLVYGRYVLIPLLGPEAFTAVAQFGKIVHNYISFAFVIGLVLTFLQWVGHNLPDKTDGAWIAAGGGLFAKGKHPPAKKFNAGQKVIFWSTVLGGLALSVSGYILMFPFAVTDIAGMQLAHLVHAIVAMILTAIIVAHIYIGSIGMEGAFDAMGSGQVDLNWAKEHHSLWVDQVTGRGRKAGAD